MDIVIREFAVGDKMNGNDIDDSFTVDSTIVLSLSGRQIRYTVKECPRYTKRYSDEQFEEASDEDYSEYIDNPNQIVYLACAENQVVGRIVLKRNWNKYAYVEDIAVDKKYRRHGVGRKLIEQAKRWAINGGMPGIMLETQSNNVSACKFYESCGFVIGGFDLHLYQGIHKHSDEIAIFWYLIFDEHQ
ncbi:GNAT family N-acetyltransferase [Brevibacillus panacihumi]|uniref:GNAT family N-acetyltransferase n=1 Tax=Brevibacillus panacihumi TaxID=497735 RepID=A0A3M8DED9_9BACL|nr:GNAT family N-acetyltransferase [Brevibacillus panacihumi]RNB86462.1 GNAT family N-acetyltransferase [Brevibacillus panacihumi]